MSQRSFVQFDSSAHEFTTTVNASLCSSSRYLFFFCLFPKSTDTHTSYPHQRAFTSRNSAIDKFIMADASLAFPMICLTLSFLFVVAVYHPSIMRHLGAFHDHIILPVYQQIARKLLNRNPINRNLPNSMPEAGYETLNLDTEDEEEQSPSPLAASSTQTTDYYRHDEDPAPDTFNILPESDTETEMDAVHRTVSYAEGPYRPRRWSAFAELAALSTRSRSHSPSGSLVSTDEYDSEWSNSALDEPFFEPRNRTDEIPIWEFELERPIYNVDSEDEQGEPMLWLDEVVEWTSQCIFAMVTPDIMGQQR